MPGKNKSISALLQSQGFNTLSRFIALLAVFTFFSLLVEGGRFYSGRNLENILRQSAVYATAGLGMTLVIITAGIDLSVGSIIAAIPPEHEEHSEFYSEFRSIKSFADSIQTGEGGACIQT